MKFDRLKRREFVTLLGGAAVAWPVVAHAQPQPMPVVGLLLQGSPESMEEPMSAFRKGLGETGFLDGRNVVFESRWAHNDMSRLPGLVADLVQRRVSVIAAPGATQAVLAAKAATATIPIVFSTSGDPVQIGIVASLNRPGGNVTGISYMNAELGGKRVSLLRELVSKAKRFGVLSWLGEPTSKAAVTSIQEAGAATGLQIEPLDYHDSRDIDAAFASLQQKRIEALLVNPSTLLLSRRVQILTLAARHAVPVIYPARFWATAGGLMSYGSSFADQFRQAGIYTGRVLKGAKPADLPILRATKFEFVINMQTANALGIDIPPTLLALADEVIE
jgi:putative ABC transport system substrate-binding protein